MKQEQYTEKRKEIKQQIKIESIEPFKVSKGCWSFIVGIDPCWGGGGCLKDFGAVEFGLHQFHNSEEPNSKPKIGRFTIIWKNTNNNWKIVKVISLH